MFNTSDFCEFSVGKLTVVICKTSNNMEAYGDTWVLWEGLIMWTANSGFMNYK
jgi:hypothetical protein